jgi:SAM-dependent methyltransferase
MNPEAIERGKREIIEKYGRWTAHNLCLGDGVYTIAEGIAGDEIKLRRVIQIISDVSAQPLRDLRILDLACLEGLYAVELALHGATVVGIEGRAVNLAKAAFAKNVFSLDNLQLLQDDVRNLSLEMHGSFDVVLCLGILYHLDAPDVFSFLTSVADVCRGFAVIDTHVSLALTTSHDFGSKMYWGKTYAEHAADSRPEEKATRLWSSLDNTTSFWFTRSSLYNALSQVGFSSVFECHIPPEPDKPIDRITLLAMKGRRESVCCSPLLNAKPLEELPEEETSG